MPNPNDPNVQRRIVSDIIGVPKPKSDMENLLDRWEAVNLRVSEQMRNHPTIDAATRTAFVQKCSRLLMDEIYTWPKEDVLFVLVAAQTRRIMQEI